MALPSPEECLRKCPVPVAPFWGIFPFPFLLLAGGLPAPSSPQGWLHKSFPFFIFQS